MTRLNLFAVALLISLAGIVGMQATDASATPQSCDFGNIVQVHSDVHPESGCQVHILVPRGDLVGGVELNVTELPALDFDEIEIVTGDVSHSFSVVTLPQETRKFRTNATDCDCTPQSTDYAFDHFVLVPDFALPPFAEAEVRGLPGEEPQAASSGFWLFGTDADSTCPQLQLPEPQPPVCYSCDLCGVAADNAPQDSGCAISSGNTPASMAWLGLLLAIAIGQRRRRTTRQ